MSAQLLSTWTGRLALLVTALGLVLMHHVVGAHQHSTADAASAMMDQSVSAPAGAPPLTAGHTEPHATSPARHSGIGHGVGPPSPAPAGAPGLTPASSAALLHHHPDGDGHDHTATLAHLCLAALLGTVTIVLLVAMAVGAFALPRPAAAPRMSGAPTRAPPVPLRLAQLQVLRL